MVTRSALVSPWEDPVAVALRQAVLLPDLGIVTRDVQWDLLGILEGCCHIRSSDPRDRVFALLSLSKERHVPDLQPDYTETVVETYMRLALYIIQAGQGGRLLCNAFLADSSLDLPSWVPDWSLNCYLCDIPAPQFQAARTC